MNEPPDEKRCCSRCGETKSRTDFYSKSGICKVCCRRSAYNVAHERAPQELIRHVLEKTIKEQAFDRIVIVTIAIEATKRFLERQQRPEETKPPTDQYAPEGFLFLPQAADEFSVSLRTLHSAAAQGKLETQFFNGRKIVAITDVEQFVAKKAGGKSAVG